MFCYSLVYTFTYIFSKRTKTLLKVFNYLFTKLGKLFIKVLCYIKWYTNPSH